MILSVPPERLYNSTGWNGGDSYLVRAFYFYFIEVLIAE